ncbi:RNA polymerase-binding protein RbpA [Pseudarthrobacter sp. NPDC058329]|uniref:RNA polymerase-binding protein RbpA n=1 Tax=Pseudarthrobacter sp. NPDC058329 TaxID=3346448 RepID=UPI0036DB3144
MVHPTSGFRGTRAGVTAGTGPSLQADEDQGKTLPRVLVSYWCAKGHETQLVFLKLPEDQLPAIWDCRRCGAVAARDGEEAAGADAMEDGYKSHLEYVKERRSSQDAEDLLAGALERLRARGVLPDELLRDA